MDRQQRLQLLWTAVDPVMYISLWTLVNLHMQQFYKLPEEFYGRTMTGLEIHIGLMLASVLLSPIRSPDFRLLALVVITLFMVPLQLTLALMLPRAPQESRESVYLDMCFFLSSILCLCASVTAASFAGRFLEPAPGLTLPRFIA